MLLLLFVASGTSNWRYRLNWSSVCSHLPSSYPTITGITFCKEMIIWPNKYEQRKKSVKKCSAGCEIISYFYLFNKLLKIHLIIWLKMGSNIDKINKYQIFLKLKQNLENRQWSKLSQTYLNDFIHFNVDLCNKEKIGKKNLYVYK